MLHNISFYSANAQNVPSTCYEYALNIVFLSLFFIPDSDQGVSMWRRVGSLEVQLYMQLKLVKNSDSKKYCIFYK